MKQALIVLGLITGLGLFTATEASAVVCPRGVVRAGVCLWRGGRLEGQRCAARWAVRPVVVVPPR